MVFWLQLARDLLNIIMYFAIFYLFLISVDILIIFKFKVLGMLPMSYFVAGTGVSFLFYISKYWNSIFVSYKKRYLFIIFIINIFLISLFQLLTGVRHIVGKTFISDYLWIQISDVFDGFIIISFLFIIIILLKASLNHILSKWLMFCAIIGFTRHGIECILRILPEIIYRYLGVLDIIMLFGWLMIITTFINEEYDVRQLID